MAVLVTHIPRILSVVVAVTTTTVAFAQEPSAPADTEPAEVAVTAAPPPEAAPTETSPPTPEPPPAPAAEPPPAPPPLLPPAGPGLKLTSSFFLRYEVRENFQPLGTTGRFAESDVTVFRSRIGLATTPIDVGAGEQVVIQFTPQASGIMGALPGTVVDAALGLHEGYLRIQGENHKFDAGRFELNYGDSFIIGSLDWHETARSFDGMRLRLMPSVEKTFVDVFVTQATTTTAPGEGGRVLNNPLGAGDSYFAGIYSGLGGFIDPTMELEPYFLALVRPGTDTPDTAGMPPGPGTHTNASTLFTLGTRFKHAINIIDLRAEAGIQFGGNGATGPADGVIPDGTSIFAYQIDAEVGVSLADKKLRLALEGMIASGNDPSTTDSFEGWNQLFPTAHKFLGLTDIMGPRTNVASGVLHVAASPAADVKAMLDAHVFSRLQETAVGAGNDGFAGIEFDAGVSYALGTGLSLRGLYCVFLPSEGVFGPDRDPAHYVEIELRHDLK